MNKFKKNLERFGMLDEFNIWAKSSGKKSSDFKKGDMVKIIALTGRENMYSSTMEQFVGTICEVKGLSPSGNRVAVYSPFKTDFWFYDPDDLEKI